MQMLNKRSLYKVFLGLLMTLLLASCQQNKPNLTTPTAAEELDEILAKTDPHITGQWQGNSKASRFFPIENEQRVLEPSNKTDSQSFGAQTYFVEFAGAPSASGGQLATMSSEQNAFATVANEIGLEYTERYRYNRIFNGMSVQISSKDVIKLLNIPGVKAVYPVGYATIPEVKAEPVSDPKEVREEVFSTWELTGVDIAKEKYGLTGKGVLLAVIDSGFDTDHPEFVGRIVKQKDFVGKNWNKTGDPLEPDDNADVDCPKTNVHGSHVAAIAAGSIVGVAPGADIAVYKASSCNTRFSPYDATLAAAEQAVADKVDIVNMSYGSDYGWPDAVGKGFADAGVIAISSAGNTPKLYSTGSPANGNGVISVASYDNTKGEFTIALREDDSKVVYIPAGGFEDEGNLPSGKVDNIVYVGRGCKGDDYEGDTNGKVALIIRGSCTFNEKYNRALSEGATDIIVYNNQKGAAPISMGGVTSQEGAFAVMIGNTEGAALREALATSSPSLTFNGDKIIQALPTGGKLSNFTAYGLAPDLTLEPDVGAPGGSIYSAVPNLTEGDATYGVLSGTSMASPHTAGAMALILEYRRSQGLTTTPEFAATLLKNTATPTEWSECDNYGICDLGIFDPAHRQGAGMINVPKALTASTFATPSSVSLGESEREGKSSSHTITVQNLTDKEQTYDLSAVTSAIATDHSLGFQLPDTTKVFFQPEKVTVAAGSTAEFIVTVQAPTDVPDGTMYGGFVNIAPQSDNTNSVNVPFGGFKGDYQDLTAIRWVNLAERVLVNDDPEDPEYELHPLPAGTRYSLSGEEYPIVGFSLNHSVKELKLELLPQDDLAWLGTQVINEVTEIGINEIDKPYSFTLNLNNKGISPLGGYPDGRYKFRLTVLKAGGDRYNPEHRETSESDYFFIDRKSANN